MYHTKSEPYGLWVILMCQSRFISCNRWTTLVEDVENGRGYACVEKVMAPHSSTLAWKIPRMEEPGRLQSMGSRRVRLHFHFSLSCTGEGNGNPLQGSCLENPRDGGAWWAAVYVQHRVGRDWCTLATAACMCRDRGFMGNLSTFLQFCCKPNIARKSNALKNG